MRKDIESLAALREKIVGVQSIGGGFWLQTMIVLDRLGVDPEKSKLQMRVIGDEPTILQALLASNIDAAVITFASAVSGKTSRPSFTGKYRGSQGSLSRSRHLHAQRSDRQFSGSYDAFGQRHDRGSGLHSGPA